MMICRPKCPYFTEEIRILFDQSNGKSHIRKKIQGSLDRKYFYFLHISQTCLHEILTHFGVWKIVLNWKLDTFF
jgi:hypothetical protein